MKCDRCEEKIAGEFFVTPDGLFCADCDTARRWEQPGTILTDRAKIQLQEMSKKGCGAILEYKDSEPIKVTFEFEFIRESSWKINRLINAIWKRL